MPEKLKEENRHVEAVLKALEILDCFEYAESLKLKDLVQMTGLNKSRVIRLCGTLLSMGYLSHDEQKNAYKLGTKLLILGKAYEKHHNLIALARPLLRELVGRTSETASIFVIDGTRRLCLMREEADQPIRFTINEGNHLELYLGSSGKLLLAFAPEGVRSGIFDQLVESRDAYSKKLDIPVLRAELAVIEKQGFALSDGERLPDVNGISVPVYNHAGEVYAALTLAGPSYRFTDEKRMSALGILADYAKRLSRILGYNGS